MNPNEDRNHLAYVRGDKAFRARRFSEAISWFKEAIAEWPDDYQAHFALGNSYSEAGKHRKAEMAYREAMRLAPEKERPDIQFNLGNALYDQGNVAAALVEYEAVPSGSSVHGAAVHNMALALAVAAKQPNLEFKPTAEVTSRLNQTPPRGSSVVRRWLP